MNGPSRALAFAALLAALLLTGHPALAQADAELAPPAGAEQPQPAAPADDKEMLDEQELGRRVLASLAEASQRLQEGVIDETTVAAQQSAADQIDALLKRLRDNAQPSSPQPESDSSSSSASGTGDQQSLSRPNANRDAAQSSEDANEGAAADDTEIARRRNLAQAVWGHLPPKVQEELERSFSERFAPKYDALIRRYYEALAREANSP